MIQPPAATIETHYVREAENAENSENLENSLSQQDKMLHVRKLLYPGMTKNGIHETALQVKADFDCSIDEALEYVQRAIKDRDRGV